MKTSAAKIIAIITVVLSIAGTSLSMPIQLVKTTPPPESAIIFMLGIGLISVAGWTRRNIGKK